MEEDLQSLDMSALEQLQALKDAQARKIRLNIGGVRHETYKSTLANIPDTRLAWLTQPSAMSNSEYDPVNKEFYFDRHPRIFDAILNFYRTGNLHAPSDVCGPAFEQELQFWGIDEKQIEPCCWSSYTQHRDAQETLAKLTGPEFESDDDIDEPDVASYFDIAEDREEAPARWQLLRPKVWTFLEDPYSSKGAAVFAIISTVAVVLSITTFCLETTFTSDEKTAMNTLFYVEGVCVMWFVSELIIRFIFCPNKKKYFVNPFHIIDFIGCVPFFVDCIVRLTDSQINDAVAEFFGFIRIVRIFRVFKMTRHFSGLQILIQTIRSSAKELMLLSMFLGIGVLTFGSLLYYAEKTDDDDSGGGCQRINNIPVGFWWAVVTMTTVGYGDVCPLKPIGKLIGSVTGVFGVLMIALPVPVIVNNFALYYSHAQARLKLPKKRKRVLVDVPDALKGHTIQNMSSSISGYSTQSTNDMNELDNSSVHSDRIGNDRCNLKTVSASIPVSGEKTNITVQFMDELSYKSSSPDRTKSIKKPGVGKRASILPRPSLATNGITGDARGTRGSNSFKNRRRSFLPPAMTDISSC
ncbi:potassium voltage-gated channel protein Shaw-like [Antedon mediterranea]|uniref:potassium voltage-gated channel protein Shaw-like n=1 Tax=Antedon mediterranea TaxID=105859 RepID=UPI003AF40C6E